MLTKHPIRNLPALSLLALAKVDDMYKNMKIDPNNVILKFNKISKTKRDKLKGFTIAGDNFEFILFNRHYLKLRER
ncbi:MAG TPA: hypothetical protein DDX75_15870 [Phycisphaerales bacterium]|nr:hypothetical protein [Phycisphaerales bacterium]